MKKQHLWIGIIAIILFGIVYLIIKSRGPKKIDDNSNNINNKSNPKSAAYNVIVLLDLSDRIKINKQVDSGQVDQDKKTIQIILDLFEENNRDVTSKDSFSLAIAPQAGFNISCGEIKTIEMKGSNPKKFKAEKEELLKIVDCIYEQAAKNKTNGADIYAFFKDNLDKYIKSTDEITMYENKVVVISDGYLLFDENEKRQKGTYMSLDDLNMLRNKPDSEWRAIMADKNIKLSPDGIDIKNVDVLMTEINPREVATNEIGIIKKYWTDWFEGIGIFEPEFILHEETFDGTKEKNAVKKFIYEKKNFRSKMKIPVALSGKNYKSHILTKEDLEIIGDGKSYTKAFVNGLDNGKFLRVDIASDISCKNVGQKSDEEEKDLQDDCVDNILVKRVITFEKGKYVIKNSEKYDKSLTEFYNNVAYQIEKGNYNYRLFIKGEADYLGNDTFQGAFVANYVFKKICYLPRYGNSESLYLPTVSSPCQTVSEPFENDKLPNLRAKFFQKMLEKNKFLSVEILDGTVSEIISEKKRNVTFMMYLPPEFFNKI
jgi:hypothetical protein